MVESVIHGAKRLLSTFANNPSAGSLVRHLSVSEALTQVYPVVAVILQPWHLGPEFDRLFVAVV